jgi:hypothetical protein
MRFVLFFVLTLSFNALATDWYTRDAADPRLCGNNSTCVEGIFGFVGVGKMLARGTSTRSCEDAIINARTVFQREFGRPDSCGLFSGPHLKDWSCTRRNGQIVAWLACDPRSGSRETAQTQRRNCVLGGVWICGQ